MIWILGAILFSVIWVLCWQQGCLTALLEIAQKQSEQIDTLHGRIEALEPGNE